MTIDKYHFDNHFVVPCRVYNGKILAKVNPLSKNLTIGVKLLKIGLNVRLFSI